MKYNLGKTCNICKTKNVEYAEYCCKCGSVFQKKTVCYDGFISYRRESGSEIARLIKVFIEQKTSFNFFLDVDGLSTGLFDEKLLEIIKKTDNFILILTLGALDRCINEDDWLRREISCAISHDRNIIPIMKDGFTFPSENELPFDIRNLPRYNAVLYNHRYVESTVRDILKFMKGKFKEEPEETLLNNQVTRNDGSYLLNRTHENKNCIVAFKCQYCSFERKVNKIFIGSMLNCPNCKKPGKIIAHIIEEEIKPDKIFSSISNNHNEIISLSELFEESEEPDVGDKEETTIIPPMNEEGKYELLFIVVEGTLKGETFLVEFSDEKKEVIIGRSIDAGLYIEDNRVSREHAKISIVLHEGKTKALLTDLKSSNGTFLNGKRVKRYFLKLNDIIRIGQNRLILKEISLGNYEDEIGVSTLLKAMVDSLKED